MIFGALWLVGCAGHAARTEEARSALDFGEPKRALTLLNEELDVESAKQVPADAGGDNALLLLDRSMVLQQLGSYRLSSRDLEIADKQIEVLDLSRGAVDDLGRYLFSDDTGPYRAPAYEKLLINTMNMINYLALGDLNGARVEARRLAVMQKFIEEHDDPSQALMGPGSYLAGFSFEKSGRPQQALRYYDEALQYGDYQSLVEPIRRLAAKASYRSPRIRKILDQAPPQRRRPRSQKPGTLNQRSGTGNNLRRLTAGDDEPGTGDAVASHSDEPSSGDAARSGARSDAGADETARSDAGADKADNGDAPSDDADTATPSSAATGQRDPAKTGSEPASAPSPETGEILVIVSYGRVPPKVAKRVPIGLALTYASGALSPRDHARANALAAQGLVTWVNYPELGASRGTYDQPLFALGRGWQHLDGIIAVDREVRRAWDEAKGAVVASAITRMLSRVVAGEVVRHTTDKGWLGLLLSLGTQATLTAADTPDTRSWATLPARIAMGRVRVRPGIHWVTLGARGSRTRKRVSVKPGGFAVVNLTVLS